MDKIVADSTLYQTEKPRNLAVGIRQMLQGYRRCKINQIASSPEAEIVAVLHQFYVEVRNKEEATYSEIGDLPPSLRQSRCLLTSATSCPRQAASKSRLGRAPALPSPGLTVDEIDRSRYFSGSGGGPGCGIGGKITRGTAVCALTFWKMANSLTTLALWPLLHSNREKCVYVVGQPCTNMHTAAVFFFLCYRQASKHSTKKV